MTLPHLGDLDSCLTHLHGPDIRLSTGCVVTAGKFESIHLGHQALITKTRQLAAQYGVPSAVLTFTPHPKRALGDLSYRPLFTAKERTYILSGLGVDYLLEYPFDAEFAALSPEAFCQLLFASLQARAVVVGEHYRFGYRRAGTAETLAQAARIYGAQIYVMPHQSEPSCTEPSVAASSTILPKISTSVIRERIHQRAMADAARMLGFAFFIQGRVCHGKQIGRTLGFPTVNIQPDNMKFLPPDGVYVTRTRHGEQVYNSVTNLGQRPTVQQCCVNNTSSADNANTLRTVESFLLDFDGDLYGADLVTEFITFLRPERHFASLEALRAQIALDITAISI